MNKLSHYLKERIIICSDFNDTIDNALDSSSQCRLRSSALPTLTQLEDLYDLRWCLHGTERDFTFYSAVQKSYSRIDLFLLHKLTLQTISQAGLGLIIWSDHTPVTITISSNRFHHLAHEHFPFIPTQVSGKDETGVGELLC